MDIKNLHPLEIRILRHYKLGDELSIEKVEYDLQYKPGNGNQALSWLAAKELVRESRRSVAVFFELTDMGKNWQEKGTPEERIVELVRIQTGQTLAELAGVLNMEQKDIGSAFGSLSKRGFLALDSDKRVSIALNPDQLKDGRPATGEAADYLSLIRNLLNEAGKKGMVLESDLSPEQKTAMAGMAKKRGAAGSAFRIVERETVFFTFTEKYVEVAEELARSGITGDEIGSLTPELLENGGWKGKNFRAYNVQVPLIRLPVGRMNPYGQFLEDVKDKLVSLGFEEFDGPLVESEFWNSDALFMPQFHAARDIHDVYHIAEPEFAHSIEEPWLSQVASAHENGGATGSRGWNYTFDRNFTRRLILRSQGTVMSAKTLPHAKIPGKYFGMLRCFRYDRVDATHLSDFYQTEGIVLGEDVNLRTLLGMLEMFAIEVAGAKEVKYVPGYFPFTEPSIEVHIKHPVLGWFELGGSGIFRPEVTTSLGVKVPVAAWGIGIDRMALMALGLNDLRELFSYDIENVRLRRSS
ncbi:phenylalanine--tRNA ligase alpha subunit [Spirochaetia bacterium]|nr:phenylalanine--tRNA ligase alpha subunit [Spirochaetia bacterium]GHU36512.1 phenylalanine--tRNA ligase alpha subunit [Spirochaetia bacterium]